MANPDNNMQLGSMNDRVQSYQNICNILTESVTRAKQRYQHLAPGNDSNKRSKMGSNAQNQSPGRGASGIPGVPKADLANLETDERIKK